MAGYSGGDKLNPTYRSMKDHTESVLVKFDPRKVTYDRLLAKFWLEHDPMSKGYSTQYMSAVWYCSEEQHEKIKQSIERLQKEKYNGRKIQTKVAPLGKFYKAEGYHQNYLTKRRGF
eukprot:m.334031 g.334031  ORF g.334031 m.334031 type:complete len:117 (-) comp17273_c0_seq1:595-945(-)